MNQATKPNDERHFDEKQIPIDVWHVLRTAALLNVPEFRVFEIAYTRWFGESGTENTIEEFYLPYMFSDVVPACVRHFCDQVLDDDHAGTLNPRDYGIEERKATAKQKNRGYEFLIVAVASLTIIILLSELAAQSMKLQCMFPPCY